MARNTVATLELQMIADVARLQKDMRAMERIVGDATGKASSDFNNAGKAAAGYAAEVQNMAAKSVGAGKQITATGGTAKLAGHHMQNLAFQFQDLSVQMIAAAGSSAPLKMAFMAMMQQGAQINGIMSQAGIGIKGVAAAFLAMAGSVAKAALTNPYFLAFAAAATIATGAYKLFQSSVAQSGELDRFRDGLGLTKDELKELGDVGITMGDVFKGVWRTIDDGMGLSKVFSSIKGWAVDTFVAALGYGKIAVAGIYGGFYGAYTGIAHVWKNFPAIIGEAATDAGNFAIGAFEKLLNRSIDGINWLINQINGIPMLRGGGVALPTLSPVEFGRIEQSYRGAGAAAIDAFAKGAQQGYASAQAGMTALGGNLRKNIIGAAEDRIGKAADALIEKRSDKAKKAAKKAKEEIDPMEKGLFDAWVNVQKLAAEAAAKNLEWKQEGITVAQQLEEWAQGLARLKAAELEDEQRLLDLKLQQLAVIQQMGGIAGKGAGLLSGVLTGNFSGVGGKAGQLLQGVGLSVGKDGWKAVTDKLDSIFGSAGDGSFARIMQKTFAAGGMGSLAGSMVNGSGNSAFGSFAGGALGEKFGEKFLKGGMEKIFKGLGDFAGPLGSIVGGILGGALGGLLKKAKWGTSVVTGQSAGDVSTAGNKAAYTANAGLAGSSIQGGLQAIADQFGADIGGYNVSIGQYKGKWRVSSTGRAGKLKGKYGDVTDFGKEGAEDAIKFAIADAIKDGALIGLRASTQALLRASDDVETQLQKALQFEGVFSELKSMTDPVGYALDTLDKSFDQLRKLFEEAGATTQEYADLEQLYQLKRIEAIKDANSEADELSRNRRTLEARILELQGNELASVAMMRQIELEQMEASLRPLQQRVWAMEDASAIIAEMQPFVDSLKAYRQTLFGGTDAGLTYRSALVKLMGTGGLAAAGDKVALGNLQSVSQDFLGVSKDNATSLIQYQRDLAMVARYVDGGIGAAQEQIDYAKLTLDAQDASVALLASIDASLSGGVPALGVGLGALTPGLIEPQGAGGQSSALLDEVKGMRAESHAQNLRIAENTAAIQKLMTRWDGDGLLVRGEADSPVYVSDAA